MDPIKTEEKPRDVGDLLRLKRAEKPDPEFWDGFQDNLKREIVRRMVEPVPRRRWIGIAVGNLAGAWPVASGSVAAMAALVSIGTMVGEPGASRWVDEANLAAMESAQPIPTATVEFRETRFEVEIIESKADGLEVDPVSIAGTDESFHYEGNIDFNANELQFVTETLSSREMEGGSAFEGAFFAN